MSPSTSGPSIATTDESGGDADELGGVELLVAGRKMRDQRGEDRCGGVEDRSKPARDMGLAPEDQRERNHIVEQPEHREGRPRPRQRNKTGAAGQDGEERRGDADAAERQGERRQFVDRDLGEEERAAPQNREEDEQEPVGRRQGQARRHCSMSVVLDAPATRFPRAGASVR
jgi:hypothetical protein